MAGPLYEGNCGYTGISTLGTTTVDPGPTPADPGYAGRFGVCYGFILNTAGTAGMAVAIYDVQRVATGTGTVTNTNNIMNGTLTAAGQVLQGANGVGIRYKGDLVVVTSGTAGAGNLLWD